MSRPTVTSGGHPSGRADEWHTRLGEMTAAEGPDAEARKLAQKVTCQSCGGQATADRGRVFIAHRPRCQRSTTASG